MSNSVHTSRAKFRWAYRFRYSREEDRERVLGKILDEVNLKRAVKRNVKDKRRTMKIGVAIKQQFVEDKMVLSKRAIPSKDATEMVDRHIKRGYGGFAR